MLSIMKDSYPNYQSSKKIYIISCLGIQQRKDFIKKSFTLFLAI